MSSLTWKEKAKLEKLFGMDSGYVLNFNNSSFGAFLAECVDIDIHDEKYEAGGTSKANKLRQFWVVEEDLMVGQALIALIEHAEEFPAFEEEALAQECRSIANRLLGNKPNVEPLKKLAAHFDATYLAQQIKRMEQSIDSDPDLAIGTAKELIETCCKTILELRGNQVEDTHDIPKLTKATLKELKLVPEGVPEASRGSDVIKRILQNLGTMGNNLAELRGMYGTGHGKHGKASGLKPRHAKLAVGAAATLTTFLFETHRETKS